MKKKFLIIALAMGSLGFGQGISIDSINLDSLKFKPRTPDFQELDSTIKVLINQAVVCGKNTSKNIPCKNKTKHESGCCHYHRED